MDLVRDIINQAGGWVAGGAVYIFDHWSGAAALILFATQLFINVRTIRRK